MRHEETKRREDFEMAVYQRLRESYDLKAAGVVARQYTPPEQYGVYMAIRRIDRALHGPAGNHQRLTESEYDRLCELLDLIFPAEPRKADS